MQQSYAYNDPSLALTTKILEAKAQKDLSWQDLTDGTGLGLAYVTAALLGQHPLPESAAKVIGEKLELDADAVARLQIIPLRGSLCGVPTDPTIYRFYEMIQIYGTTLKARFTNSSATASSARSTSNSTSKKSKTRKAVPAP